MTLLPPSLPPPPARLFAQVPVTIQQTVAMPTPQAPTVAAPVAHPGTTGFVSPRSSLLGGPVTLPPHVTQTLGSRLTALDARQNGPPVALSASLAADRFANLNADQKTALGDITSVFDAIENPSAEDLANGVVPQRLPREDFVSGQTREVLKLTDDQQTALFDAILSLADATPLGELEVGVQRQLLVALRIENPQLKIDGTLVTDEILADPAAVSNLLKDKTLKDFGGASGVTGRIVLSSVAGDNRTAYYALGIAAFAAMGGEVDFKLVDQRNLSVGGTLAWTSVLSSEFNARARLNAQLGDNATHVRAEVEASTNGKITFEAGGKVTLNQKGKLPIVLMADASGDLSGITAGTARVLLGSDKESKALLFAKAVFGKDLEFLNAVVGTNVSIISGDAESLILRGRVKLNSEGLTSASVAAEYETDTILIAALLSHDFREQTTSLGGEVTAKIGPNWDAFFAIGNVFEPTAGDGVRLGVRGKF